MPVSQGLTRIEAQHGTAVRIAAGATLRIVAIEPQQVADIALFDAGDIRESFSSARTMDYNETIDAGVGSTLYSHGSLALARITEDTVGVNDILLAPCSAAMFERRAQFSHRSCHENLWTALRPFGIGPYDVLNTLNVFMDVRVDARRRISLYPPPSRPGDRFALQAFKELIVGISACSSDLTNAGCCKPIAYEIMAS